MELLFWAWLFGSWVSYPFSVYAFYWVKDRYNLHGEFYRPNAKHGLDDWAIGVILFSILWIMAPVIYIMAVFGTLPMWLYQLGKRHGHNKRVEANREQQKEDYALHNRRWYGRI